MAGLQNTVKDGVEASVETAELDSAAGRQQLIDPFGRAISYLRVSGLGDGPLRFPLRLLHGGKHVVSAEVRNLDAGRA
jgi:hypothetical protein